MMAPSMRQPIDVVAFTNYIREHLPEIRLPISLKQFSHGQSNPTYEIISGTGQKYVLRKKPPGDLLSESAHRIDREYTVLKALAKTNVPVPKTYALCEDSRVIGTPFYIMEFLDGRIFEDPWLPDQSAENRDAIWKAAIRTLGLLHNVDVSLIGLENWRKPSSYYTRQIRALSNVSLAQAQTHDLNTREQVGSLPYYDELVSFFADKTSQPTSRTTLVHGDFKLDNLVFHHTEARVIGILDWEMASIGHPLSDLVNLTAPYLWSATPVPLILQLSLTEELRTVQRMFSPGIVPGLPDIAACFAQYHELVGWDPKADFDWAVAFSFFRSAVIMQGIAARLARGQASGVKAREYALQTLPYALWSYEKLKSLRGRKEIVNRHQALDSCK